MSTPAEAVSESSDEETFQPAKKGNKSSDFDPNFSFFSTMEEYTKDSWNDLKRYIKRNPKSKTDDKINKIRATNNDTDGDEENEESDKSDSEFSLSDSELKHDKIKDKLRKKKKKTEVETNGFFDENVTVNTETVSFHELHLSRPLLKAINEMNYGYPTPVQAAAIPVALTGQDICGCAATGTGKTAAYLLPTLERLLFKPVGTAVTRVLILLPTRELCTQVYKVARQLSQHTNIQIGLAVGGLDLKIQENVLRKNPDIVVATPGRLIDHLKNTPTFGLDSVEILILDEADRMLDEYFEEQMKEIIKQCSRTRQTILFSATMTDEVERLAAVSLEKPARLFIDSNRDVAFNLRQEFIRIRSEKDQDREAILAALVCRTFRDSCMVFVQTKKQTHRIHILLGLLGLKVAELHGNLTQPQRLEALEKFKNKTADILVATDVAARGLDIVGVKTVINFIMPSTLEQYIHRVGRTARAGRAGVSVSLAGEQERRMVKQVIKKAKHPAKTRIIPPDILNKYRDKLTKLGPQIEQILQEEREERLLSKAENQANKIENILKGDKKEERPWFQTKKQRMQEKQRLDLKAKENKNMRKDKKKTKKKNITEEDIKLQKKAAAQARQSKKQQRSKKIYTVKDDMAQNFNKKKKRKGNFENDLKNKKKRKF